MPSEVPAVVAGRLVRAAQEGVGVGVSWSESSNREE
jgi:hypothetical protein